VSKTSPTWLIDKSAYARLGRSADDQTWAGRIDRRLVRITTLTRVELGYSARTAADWRAELELPPLAAMPVQYLTPAIEDRAVERFSSSSPTGVRAFRTSWSRPRLSSPA
jgi:predicted nucleic acid-binding protein